MSKLKLEFLLIFINAVINVSYSQSNTCASLTPEQSDVGYKRLPNRCEGFYEPKLAGNLQVVSFIMGGDVEFSWKEQTELEVYPIDSLETPLNIRAVSLQRNVFYQMDALLHRNKAFEWPVGPYIYRRSIRPDQLGIYGWTGEEYDKIFSPVRVIEKGSTHSQNQTILLKIRTVLDLTNFRWDLTPTNGSICKATVGPYQVFEGNMTAGSVIEIDITQFTKNVKSLCLEIQYRPENKRWQSELLKIKI